MLLEALSGCYYPGMDLGGLMLHKKTDFNSVWLSLLFCCVVMSLLIGCASTSGNHVGHGEDGLSAAESKLGIEPKSLRLSAGGYMLDFRFRITDPEKASPLMKGSIMPYIIDEKSGAKLFIPVSGKVGALRSRSRDPDTHKTFFILFANPGLLVRSGDTVRLVVDDMVVGNLIVE